MFPDWAFEDRSFESAVSCTSGARVEEGGRKTEGRKDSVVCVCVWCDIIGDREFYSQTMIRQCQGVFSGFLFRAGI